MNAVDATSMQGSFPRVFARIPSGFLVVLLAASSLQPLGAYGQAGAPPASAASATMGPQEIVENSAQRMLKELDANRAMYKSDSAKLDGLVANVLLPNFDSELAARLVLGQAWRTATADQRKRFVDAFYHSLLRNYGTALVDFTADRFRILPFRGDPNDKDATVHTEVKRSNGETVPVDFSLRHEETGWKAWDVVIEGISYVKSFRTDIGAEVQSKGLDEVIDRLEKEGISPRGVPH
jgi:phospholipid transport system substrate-binding protein